MRVDGSVRRGPAIIKQIESRWWSNLIDTAKRKTAKTSPCFLNLFQSVMPPPLSSSSSLSSSSLFLLLLLSLAIPPTTINAFEAKAAELQEPDDNLQSPLCVIGRLRMCNDDEDCLEMPAAGNGDDSNLLRRGICVCRDLAHCKRKRQSQPLSDQLLSAENQQQRHSHLGLFFGILSCLSIVGFVSFLVYYYGIRYGWIRHFARRLGLTNRNGRNAPIEDQLLDRIPDAAINNRSGDIELNI